MLPTAVPEPTPTPTAEPTPEPTAVATRIRIPAFGIDLAVVPSDLDVRGNTGHYPLCDVAMYMQGFKPPGAEGTTYIYAHAQQGMFLPLLRSSRENDGAAMLGAQVQVYAADGTLWTYEVFRVKRHATNLNLTVVDPGEHRLVLQTSEGPTGTVPKLQVAATPVSVERVSRSEARPEPRPRICLPG
jgi:hypothetical protein